jgi:hypothetical protein
VDRVQPNETSLGAFSGPQGFYVQDGAGYVWVTVFYLGTIQPVLTGVTEVSYAQPGCAGPGYLGLFLPPRYVFTVAADATLRTFPDAPTITRITQASAMTSGGCVASSATVDVVALADTAPGKPITTPTKLYELPVHPEYVP